MIEILQTIFWAIVVLGILIFVHELGHFLVARWFDVRVLVFSLGFGAPLARWQKDEKSTEYRISMIPLGGYVKMLGEHQDEEEEEEIAPEDLPFTFSAQSVFARISIAFAGPLFNFIFAVFAFWAVFMMGVDHLLPVVGKVEVASPADKAGMKAGDRITIINGESVDRWQDLVRHVAQSDGAPLKMSVERENRQHTLTVTPEMMSNQPGKKSGPKRYRIGIQAGKEVETEYFGAGEALLKGAERTWDMIALTFKGLYMLISNAVSPDQLRGPIFIAELAGKTAEAGWVHLLNFMALISVNLGIINLLPIPVLDGGHILFCLIEAVKGGPLDEQKQMVAMRVGMTFLLALMLLAFYNDLADLFIRWSQ
ncbi:RIP metalloprotease RseP [Magnetococcales bacterium HHB-1]